MILASIWYVVVYWNPNMHMCDQMKSLVKITLGEGASKTQINIKWDMWLPYQITREN
jgi:hypothetical protein